MTRRTRRTKISGQFAWRLIEMLESPAYRALSLCGRRVIDRLEIELGSHGGTNNGRLPVTYGDFERYGMDEQSIPPALREVQALGFVEITERGRPSESDFGRHPNLFRITYRHGANGEQPTDEWRQHTTLQEARKIARAAREAKDPNAVAKSKVVASKKADARGGKFAATGGKIHPAIADPPGWKIPHTVPPGQNPGTIDISDEGEAA
jgi:hypothetical protein